MGQKVGPLAGIPFAVKDLEDSKDLMTSFGCKPIADKNEIARRDSVQVSRLKAAGAIVCGKTNGDSVDTAAGITNALLEAAKIEMGARKGVPKVIVGDMNAKLSRFNEATDLLLQG